MNRLKELRKAANKSQTMLASELNVAQNTISQWENGTRDIDSDKLYLLTSYFQVSSDYLLGISDMPYRIVASWRADYYEDFFKASVTDETRRKLLGMWGVPEELLNRVEYLFPIPAKNNHLPYSQVSQSVIVPVYGVIPAGIPMEAIEDIIDYEEIPAEMAAGGKEFFALRLRGNSMSPDYEEGDTVIYQIADDCESGDECAVIVNGEEATFKKVIKQKGGVVLQPLNVAEYEPMYYSNKEIEELPVRVIGIARELRRKK